MCRSGSKPRASTRLPTRLFRLPRLKKGEFFRTNRKKVRKNRTAENWKISVFPEIFGGPRTPLSKKKGGFFGTNREKVRKNRPAENWKMSIFRVFSRGPRTLVSKSEADFSGRMAKGSDQITSGLPGKCDPHSRIYVHLRLYRL